MLLQVDQIIPHESGIQAVACPEGLAPPLASHLALLHSFHRREKTFFRYGAFNAQAGLLSFREYTTEVRPLRSTGVTPLPRYYGPLRIPTVNAEWVIDSPPALSLRRNPFASGITSDLPVHHLWKDGRCRISVTRPNRVRLRWARVFVVRVVIVPFAL